jgi:hypothetical protein
VPCGLRVEVTHPAPTIFGAYYMVPTEGLVHFQIDKMLAELKEGVWGIEYDEPEYFHRAGYSEAFKREWRLYYGDEWADPESSVDARFRAERLKAYLLQRQIELLFRAAKARRPDLLCKVNPHSPMNYGELFAVRSLEGGITSMQGALAHMPEVDAVLGEVWSDTIRAPMIYIGRPTVEPFLHSYVERSYFRMLCLDSQRRLFHLLDPKSDDPKYPWLIYRGWFEQDTLAAWLLGGQHFNVAWPDRLYLGDQPPAGPAPDEYKTVFTTFTNVCRELEHHPYDTLCGIGVPVTDTVMWQRGFPGRGYLDAIYALTLPLLDQGVEVQVLPLERGPEPGFLGKFKVLLTSFDFWQPHERAYADSLIEWVNAGGVMVYFGTSEFDDVPSSWWRQAGYTSNFAYLMEKLGCSGFVPAAAPITPVVVSEELRSELPATLFDAGTSEAMALTSTVAPWNSLQNPHLYEAAQLLEGVPDGAQPLMQTRANQGVAWRKPCGKGWLVYVGVSPWHLAYGVEGAQILRSFTRYAAGLAKIAYAPSGALDVSRGPFRLAYAFQTYPIQGCYLDLADHTLRTVTDVTLHSHQYAVLYRLPDATTQATGPALLFSAAKCGPLRSDKDSLELQTEGPQGTLLITAIQLQSGAPRSLAAVDEVTQTDVLAWHSYEPETGILRVAHRGGEKSVTLRVSM